MSILFVGCGKMGAAMAGGMARRDRVHFIDPHVETVTGARKIESIDDLAAADRPALIILATKPDAIDEACKLIAPLLAADTIVISLAAGIRLDRLAAKLGSLPCIIRLMPNLAVLANSGVLAFAAPALPDDDTRHFIGRRFSPLGSIFWLRSEEELDAVTALSGSGPAYLLLMTEQMRKEAARLGMDDQVAEAMAYATLCGVGHLLAQRNDGLDSIRADITSPGGTTAAAIAVLEKDDALRRLVGEAMSAAVDRARMLAAV
jgi:pyrroline-5-carboxylate reductase